MLRLPTAARNTVTAPLFAFVALVTERLKWGQEGFSNPAMYTVVVTSQWTVSRVMHGWQQ